MSKSPASPLSPPSLAAGASARDRLLESAQRLLWEHGYEAMSPRMVMEDSGVGQGSLYHHFKTKKDLAHAALEGIAAWLTERALSTLAAPGRTPLECIEDWLTLPRDGLKGCRVGRLASEQAIHDEAIGGPVGSYFVALRAALEDALRKAQHQGELSEDVNVVDLAAMLVATVQGGYILARGCNDAAALQQALAGALAAVRAVRVKKA